MAVGAEVLRHRPGRLSVIRARYRADATPLGDQGWACVPFGMEHPTYLDQVAEQAAQLPRDIGRIVVPVGSGITLAAVLHGLYAVKHSAQVLGVRVGGNPAPALDRYAPRWPARATLTTSTAAYGAAAPNRLGTLVLDPHYEAKTLPFLDAGDLLWTVGVRASALAPSAVVGP